jgi:hypothetical protein
MAVVGIVGGFADASPPHSKSTNLLPGIPIINHDQQNSYVYDNLDACLGNGSTSPSSFPPAITDEFSTAADFDFEINTLSSLPDLYIFQLIFKGQVVSFQHLQT